MGEPKQIAWRIIEAARDAPFDPTPGLSSPVDPRPKRMGRRPANTVRAGLECEASDGRHPAVIRDYPRVGLRELPAPKPWHGAVAPWEPFA